MTEATGTNPVVGLQAYLRHLVRSDPAQVLPAVADIVLALHTVAMESVSATPSPNLFVAGRSLARIDTAGVEITLAIRELADAAGEQQRQAAARLARIEELIATLPLPQQRLERLPTSPVRARALAAIRGTAAVSRAVPAGTA